MPDLESLTPDQRLALKSAAANLREHFAGTFSQETIELFLGTQLRPVQQPGEADPLPAADGRAVRPPAADRPRACRGTGQDDGVPWCCSCASTTRGDPRWHWLRSTTAGDRRSSGPAGPSRARGGIAPRSKRWRRASTTPASTPSHGRMRSCRLPTWSSPWDVATHARSFPANATRSGYSRTRPVSSVDAVRPIRDEIGDRVRRLLAEPRRARRLTSQSVVLLSAPTRGTRTSRWLH